MHFILEHGAELGITSASEEATRRIFAARDAFLLKDFEAAIRHMNQVDLDSFYSERVLIETFNPRFFEEISLPFVMYLFDKNIGEELLGQSWFRALAMIPSVIQAFESLSQESDAGKEKFHATRQRITCFAKCKQVAHAYGLIGETVRIDGGVDYKLGLSYPGVLTQMTREHGANFAHRVQPPKKRGRALLDQGLFLSARQNGVQGLILEAVPISLSLSSREATTTSNGVTTLRPVERVHLVSLVTCDSPTYGLLLALGDRGGQTKYRGVQIYRVQNRAGIQEFLGQVRDSLYSPIQNNQFSDLLRPLALSVVDEIPGMEQLRSYCGFQSAGELNEFSLSLFAAMHGVRSCRGTPLNLGDALETAKGFIYDYHIGQMNTFRVSVLGEAMGFLAEHPRLGVGQSFFDDLKLVEERYGCRSQHLVSQGSVQNSPLPAAYAYYLKQQRYPSSQQFLPHQLAQIETALTQLFSMFKRLGNDFDESLLFDMKALDKRLRVCHSIGFERAEAFYFDRESRKRELSTRNPLNPSHATAFREAFEKYKREHSGEEYGPGALGS